MTALKRVYSLILMSVLSLVIILATSMQANAGYGYKVTIALGGSGEEGAYFSSISDSALTLVTDTATTSFSDDGSQLIIEGLQKGDTVSFNPTSSVALSTVTKTDEDGNSVEYQKYYVKGIRLSGANSVASASAFTVDEDKSFVIAYGVGETVAYTVKYVDDSGNTLLDDDTFYGLEGEEVYVPYRYIAGYTPNAYNLHTSSLTAGKVFTFVYTKSSESGSSQVVYVNGGTVTEYGTAVGDPEYTYQTVSRPVTDTGVVNNRDTTTQGTDDGTDTTDTEDASEDSTEIYDDFVPEGIEEVVEIDEEDVAKVGDQTNEFYRNMMAALIIAIIAVLAILTTVYKTFKDNVDSRK